MSDRTEWELREAYRAMRMSDDANWGEFCGCCGVILSLDSGDEECGPAHTAAQMIHAWLERNPDPSGRAPTDPPRKP